MMIFILFFIHDDDDNIDIVINKTNKQHKPKKNSH